MSKQATLKPKKLPTNLVMADLYAYRPEPVKGLSQDKYFELVEVEQEDGSRIEKLVEQDYPITADYVKSFEQSADYKLDVDGAIAAGHSGKNLGDVTALQELYAMDSAAIEEYAKRLTQAADVLKKAKAKTAESKTEKTEQGENVNG